jgi:hypothetical protein
MATTPSFVDAGAVVSGSAVTTVSVSVPVTAQEGDHLLIVLSSRGGTQAPVTGWTPYTRADGSGFVYAEILVWHKICDADDAGSSVTAGIASGTTSLRGACLAWRPSRRNNPVPAETSAGSGTTEVTSLDIPGITSNEGNYLAIACVGSTENTAEDVPLTQSYGTTRLASSNASQGIGVLVVEDTGVLSGTRTASCPAGALMTAVLLVLAGNGGQMAVL